jgi:F-type H+-transporting ATPase subunit a
MDVKEILEHHIIDHAFAAPLSAGPLSLPLTKHFLMIILVAALIGAGLPLLRRSRSARLAPFRSMLEALVLFIRDEVVVQNMGRKGARYTGYFCTLFVFILGLNLAGMVPFGATATGNLAVTGGFALCTFLLVNLAGMREQGVVRYVSHLVPAGVPVWLYPLLFPIEVLGLVTKAFALCIRLFANMIAGHIVILSFIGMIFIFGAVNPWLGVGVTAPAAVVLVIFVSLLEIFVAFLQAYIFTFLTAIFTGAAMHPH